MTGDFCHSERSRGISNYLESENRDVSTALNMTKREKLLIKAKALPILDPGVLNRAGGWSPARAGSRRAPKIECGIIAIITGITRWIGHRIFRCRITITVAERIAQISVCSRRIGTKHGLL